MPILGRADRWLHYSEGDIIGFEITRTRMVQLNTNRRPCDQMNLQNVKQCFKQYLNKQLGCHIPWSVIPDKNGKSEPICSTMEQKQKFVNISNSLGNIKPDDLFKMTGCIKNCVHTKYQLTEFYGGKDESDQHKFFITSYEQEINSEEEYYIFDLNDFIAAFGGYLGLLIGVDMLFVSNKIFQSQIWSKLVGGYI